MTSFRSRASPDVSCGMNVPSLKRMPSHSPSAGQSRPRGSRLGPPQGEGTFCHRGASQPSRNGWPRPRETCRLARCESAISFRRRANLKACRGSQKHASLSYAPSKTPLHYLRTWCIGPRASFCSTMSRAVWTNGQARLASRLGGARRLWPAPRRVEVDSRVAAICTAISAWLGRIVTPGTRCRWSCSCSSSSAVWFRSCC